MKDVGACVEQGVGQSRDKRGTPSGTPKSLVAIGLEGVAETECGTKTVQAWDSLVKNAKRKEEKREKKQKRKKSERKK